MAAKTRTRRVAMLAYPDIQILDAVGPLEVFSRASRLLRAGGGPEDAYQVELIGLAAGPFAASSGLRLFADRGFRQVKGGLDTLLVSGGRGSDAQLRNPALLAWLRDQALRVRRIGSVCTGAFLLAAAGLLDGRRATTHWSEAERLRRQYPKVRLDPDRIYIREGNVYTSAGVTSGMDLALAMVEEDHGRQLALDVARQLVLFLRRPGGQSQFSAQLSAQFAEREPINDLQGYIVDHPERDLSVEALASRVAMSPRNFARVFTRELGTTPARFVTAVRLEKARRLLEESPDGLEMVCSKSGFGTAEAMRRAFIRKLGVPPRDYRQRFSSRRQRGAS